MKMPIVIQFPDGYMYLLAGNTRLALCFKNKINPTVALIKAQ
jgi:hypothetical protein